MSLDCHSDTRQTLTPGRRESGVASGLEPSVLDFSAPEKELEMAAYMHPAAIWLIIAAVVGIVLLIATIVANRNEKKKKKGKSVDMSLQYFNREVSCLVLRQLNLS